MFFTIGTLAFFYLVLVALVAVFQRRLMYFPRCFASKLGEILAAQEGFKGWRNGGGELVGWKLSAAGNTIGSVLILHGNAGCALDRGYLASPIHEAAPLDVYLLEYPGYGSRAGSPSLDSIVNSAEEAFGLLPKDKPIYLVSESIGTGPAAYLAQKHGAQVAGMALLAPYDDLAAVGQRQMPYLPVSLLLRDRFRPSVWLQEYRGPVFILVAGSDEIIPPEFALRLHDRYAGPKRLEVVPGAGHNDVPTQSSLWWQAVLKFWQHPESNG